MLRSIVASVLALALGMLPVIYDVCGPECVMGDAPAIVEVIADGGADGECPLHPAEDQAATHETDGCTHDHGIVREAPESTLAFMPSDQQSLELPVTVLCWTAPDITAGRRGYAAVSLPFERSPHPLALRI